MSASLQRILYVEDEVDIRTVAKLALEAVGGFEVEVAVAWLLRAGGGLTPAPQRLQLQRRRYGRGW